MIKRNSRKTAESGTGKKAVFFTLGFLLAGLAVFSFAAMMQEEADEGRQLFSGMVLASRMEETSSSLQECVRDSFASYSGISISMDNRSFMIEEELPNNMSDFTLSLASLKNFSEASGSEIHLNLEEVFDRFPLIISPQGIRYIHNSSTKVTLASSRPFGSIASGHKTTITMSENTTCDWSYDSGSFEYELEVVSPSDSGCDRSRSIDLNSTAVITITGDWSGESVTINLTAKGLSAEMSSGNFTAVVRNRMETLSTPGGAWLGEDLISIRYSSFEMEKKSGARII